MIAAAAAVIFPSTGQQLSAHCLQISCYYPTLSEKLVVVTVFVFPFKKTFATVDIASGVSCACLPIGEHFGANQETVAIVCPFFCSRSRRHWVTFSIYIHIISRQHNIKRRYPIIISYSRHYFLGYWCEQAQRRYSPN